MTSNLDAYSQSTAAQLTSPSVTHQLSSLSESALGETNRWCGTYAVETFSENSDSTQPSKDLPLTDDEKFGLLSAYLDDEVSEEERCLVNHWLKSDAQMKQTYQKQLQLRAALKLLSGDLLSGDLLSGDSDQA